jgi:hypothetical protein
MSVTRGDLKLLIEAATAPLLQTPSSRKLAHNAEAVGN